MSLTSCSMAAPLKHPRGFFNFHPTTYEYLMTFEDSSNKRGEHIRNINKNDSALK